MSVTAEAESGVAAALSRLAGATHRALADRIVRAAPAGFERLIHAYLVSAGYRDIEWIKRVGEIAYATATAPGLARTVLISARSGDTPIDRRGIGEEKLRVGVEAEGLRQRHPVRRARSCPPIAGSASSSARVVRSR